MPQGPIATAIALFTKAKSSINALGGSVGETIIGSGTTVAFNQTAAAVIKVGAGRVAKVVIVAPGSTSGAFTLNDSATTGGAAIGNELWSAAFNGTGIVAGAVINLDMPFVNGLVISAVPGSGSPIVNIVYA